jgi:hypothetical protein
MAAVIGWFGWSESNLRLRLGFLRESVAISVKMTMIFGAVQLKMHNSRAFGL